MTKGKGTVLITGANSSLAIPSIQHLLTNYPTHNVLLTVRNTNTSDANTQQLLKVLSPFPSSRYSLRPLDLSSLSAVQTFAAETKTEIIAGTLEPLVAIICNAFKWSITSGLKITSDGYESSMAVNHLAHLSLSLRLLDSFAPEGGRIVILGSDAHYPGKSGLEKYPPLLPENLELLVKPEPDKVSEEVGRGFQRYGLSKAVAIMGMYQLNTRLQKSTSPHLRNITALALDPGGLPDSRCMNSSANIPAAWTFLMKRILQPLFLGPLAPLFTYFFPSLALRSTRDAAVDVVVMAVGDLSRGDGDREREGGGEGEGGGYGYGGYYGNATRVKLGKEQSSPETRDERIQVEVWRASLRWVGMERGNTVLEGVFD
ncbi:hypothetical protein SBOR_3074 [Sclerotinia borealis F-4128]|uniref:Short-chain dehydrogenase n=1 Tax=Sclerotinia borealis (strain F-4128) TaxID=1432307 RepID=W9CII1_SCLBF|nr:hypothetical protein SBOR_3074 [Sclerotinia borealis F-4128]